MVVRPGREPGALVVDRADPVGHEVGLEHLLLGLIRLQDGVAAQILENLNVNLKEIRKEVEIEPVRKMLRDMRKCDNLVVESLESEKKQKEDANYEQDKNIKEIDKIQLLLRNFQKDDDEN